MRYSHVSGSVTRWWNWLLALEVGFLGFWVDMSFPLFRYISGFCCACGEAKVRLPLDLLFCRFISGSSGDCGGSWPSCLLQRHGGTSSFIFSQESFGVPSFLETR